MRQTRFGLPLPARIPSRESSFVIDPRGGLKLDEPATDFPPGYTPSAQNFIVRDGALEPRAYLVPRAIQDLVVNSPILGGLEAVDVQGAAYPFASNATKPLWYSKGSWSFLSYVSANGINDPPTNSGNSLWSMTQAYDALVDDNLVVMAAPSYQSLYVWKCNTTVFSTLTAAPRAKAVAIFDNYLLAWNIQDASNNNFVQRLQWPDRGSVSSWTDANTLAGFIDLLDAKGEGTVLLPEEDRVLAFTSKEVWAVRSVGLPSIFDYTAVDRTVGCPYPGTAVMTPRGAIFLGNDYKVYGIAKGGSPAVSISDAVWKTLRENIDYPNRAWARYNRVTDAYELHYATKGNSTGYPESALYLSLRDAAWMPQTFSQALSYGWMGSFGTNSAATTWADMQTAGISWAQITQSWADLAGAAGVGPLAAYAGSSHGTLYTLSDSVTSDDGQTVTCKWRSHGVAGDDPTRQKTLARVWVDYAADSASSLSLRCSRDGGRTFDQGSVQALPTSSEESAVRFDPFCPARYPMFEVLTETGRPRLFRFHATYREQGR